jgi:hypothetical protein
VGSAGDLYAQDVNASRQRGGGSCRDQFDEGLCPPGDPEL